MILDLVALEKVAQEAHADWASNVPTMPLRTYHTTFRPETALALIAEVREMHEPFTWSFGYGPVQSCKWCADNGVSQEVASWPCPTVRALEALGGDAE